jgi:hypothetical protein
MLVGYDGYNMSMQHVLLIISCMINYFKAF